MKNALETQESLRAYRGLRKKQNRALVHCLRARIISIQKGERKKAYLLFGRSARRDVQRGRRLTRHVPKKKIFCRLKNLRWVSSQEKRNIRAVWGKGGRRKNISQAREAKTTNERLGGREGVASIKSSLTTERPTQW